MKRSLFVLCLAFFVLAFFTPFFAFGEECCIEGEYKGYHKDTPAPSCNKPGEGEFTMHIYQEKGCGPGIKGKIVDASGAVMEFEGEVTSGPDECCTFRGKTIGGGDTIEFKAILCMDGGKWYSKDGKYKNLTSGCFGEFKIKQI